MNQEMTDIGEQVPEMEERLRKGEEDALAELFTLHRDRLRRIALFRMNKQLNKRLDPDDLLQEAYLAASKRISHFKKDGFDSSFLWLRLILNQTLVDTHRRHLGAQARDLRKEVTIEGMAFPQNTSISVAFQLVDSATSPSQIVSRHEILERVQGIVAQMEPLDQEVLALRHFEELTNSETANVLGIEQKAASIRYIRALGRLKKALSNIPGFFEEELHEG